MGAPQADIREYYNDFSQDYECLRAGNAPGGYHDLIDDLEVEFAARFGRGKDLLEVGCGTGILLERLAALTRSARGINLSPGMLDKARERGLDVVEGSAVALPFADSTFDLTCSFKVLAHVPEIERALKEMVRVTRPGGHVVAEFYNPMSLRGVVKRLGPAGRIGSTRRESDVYTRFDSPRKVRQMLPSGTRIVATRGIRIVTPVGALLQLPVIGGWLRAAERALSDTRWSRLGGFFVVAAQVDEH